MDDLFKEINATLVVAVRADGKHRRQTAGLCRTITHRFKFTDIENFGGVRFGQSLIQINYRLVTDCIARLNVLKRSTSQGTNNIFC